MNQERQIEHLHARVNNNNNRIHSLEVMIGNLIQMGEAKYNLGTQEGQMYQQMSINFEEMTRRTSNEAEAVNLAYADTIGADDETKT